MVMQQTGSSVLDMLNASPEEIAALQHIARQRAAGVPDEQIFGGGLDQAGGWGFIDPVLQAAQITSSYNLGRGSIALQASADEYQRQGNPYNVVSSLQNMRDTNNSAVMSDPMLSNVQQGPASIYQDYLQSLFKAPGTTQQPGSAGAIAGTQQQSIYDSYMRDPLAAESFYSGGNPRPIEQVMQSLPEQYRNPAFAGVTTSAAQPASAPAAGTQTAQQGAARLIGAGLHSTGMQSSQFKDTLAQGNVPGFSSFNERDYGNFSPDQRANYLGLVQSTGRTSDAGAAYNDFLSKYRHRGPGAGRTYR